PRRRAQLEAVATDERPTVLFSSPHRLRSDLSDLEGAAGPERPLCVGRELTKLHEEFWWGTVSEAVARWSTEDPRGEFTLVLSGGQPPAPDLAEAVRLARDLVEGGMTPSQAARESAARTGVARREIYDELISR
ncbi:MAG: rRNA (cytidine-2'-O-)-methyltransferase, partial [Acidimicrobiia bacterium]